MNPSAVILFEVLWPLACLKTVMDEKRVCRAKTQSDVIASETANAPFSNSVPHFEFVFRLSLVLL